MFWMSLIKRLFIPATMLGISLALWAQPVVKPQAPVGFDGIWQGTLSIQDEKLTIAFHISSNSDGSFSATLDSPDQGAVEVPFDSVVVDKNKKTVRLAIAAAQGDFFGSLENDGTIIGHWSQGGMAFPLTLKRVEKAPGVSRPQEPAPPFPYATEDVTYENAKAGVKLAATLAIPPGAGPFPAVLLVAGSGPMDRDEAIFGHKPFWVLADYLARQGVVVLRADKRGIGKSTGDHAKALDGDFADDALAGIEFLKTRKEVNPKFIGIIGHSEGGIIAPRVAAASPDVAFIILMAAPGLPGDQVILSQGTLILRASGADDAKVQENRAIQEKVIAAVKQENDPAAAEKKIREILKASLPKDIPAQAIDAQVKRAASPWFRDFLSYDPRPALSKVKCPVLAMAGSKDLQVAPVENLFAIKGALDAGGNKAVTVKMLPGLNHLFQTAKTGSPAEYGKIEETFSPVALKTIGDWIAEQARSGK